MPIYEFQCEECEYRFLELRKMGDFTTGKCEKCGSLQVKKLISSFLPSISPFNGSCAPSKGG
ncbi:MAG: zinc ribbon domain-containing protein [Spirochaetes bacterium]|nr:zinc ribbon domain-containing protein [Spirochaetota bacterium]